MSAPPKSEYEPWPLDFAILDQLPDTGLIAGIHWKGRRAKDVTAEINEGLPSEARLKQEAVPTRLRVLHLHGFVRHHPASGDRIWSRTPSGRRLFANKAEYLGDVDPTIDQQEPEGGDDR